MSTSATHTFYASRHGMLGFLTMVLVMRDIFAWFVNKHKKKNLARVIVIRKEN